MKIFLLFFFVILLFKSGFPQTDDNIRFAAKVKQLEDFYKRINLKTDILGKTISDQNNIGVDLNGKKITFTKYQLLKFLFNSEKQFTVDDSLFIQTIILTHLNSPISFYDDNWYALTECSITYNNKQEILYLAMKNEVNSTRKSKWVICGAYAKFLQIITVPKDSTSILSPVSNDLNFSELTKAFNQPENLSQFFEKNTELSQNAVLATLMKSKQIKFNGVKKITYHFLQIDGWIFTVDFFNREKGNTGWLISNVKKCTKENKEKYKTEILHLFQ